MYQSRKAKATSVARSKALIVSRNVPSIYISGEFADVYKGTLQTSKGKQIVAVKVLRVCICVETIFLDLCLLKYK